jgi:hypothetical protein
MPNAGTGAFTLALTITAVDWIVHREERQRQAIRRGAAYGRLDNALIGVTLAAASDYAVTRRHTDVEFPHTPVEVILHWLRDDEDTHRRKAAPGKRFFVLEAALDFAAVGVRVVDADGDTLPDELRAVLNEVRERAAETNRRLEEMGDVQRDLMALEVWSARYVLESINGCALILDTERRKQWGAIWQGTVNLPAVPRDEMSL